MRIAHLMVVAVTGLTALLAVPSTAAAQYGPGFGYGWHGYGRPYGGYYAPYYRPRVYYAPPPVLYAPPPVVYAPTPVYVAPRLYEPPPVYTPPPAYRSRVVHRPVRPRAVVPAAAAAPCLCTPTAPSPALRPATPGELQPMPSSAAPNLPALRPAPPSPAAPVPAPPRNNVYSPNGWMRRISAISETQPSDFPGERVSLVAMHNPIGQSIRRLEDQRFLTGQGRYTDDCNWPGQAFAYVVRSTHAHARLLGVDLTAASRAPGVLGVFTAADLEADGIGPIPCGVKVATTGPMLVPDRFALCSDRVRHVGEPIALVIAESRTEARDAAELVVADYDPLPAVVDARAALEPGAPLLWPDVPGNLAFRFEKGDRAAVQAGFAAAAHVAELDLVNNRIIVAPLEHRAAIGRFDPATATYHLLLTGQGVHGIRDPLAETVFRVKQEQVQLFSPDVGGGFGVKNGLYPEWILVLWAARRLGRPVKWASDHGEDFVSTAHGRDNLTRARLALDGDGRFLALDVDTVANLGASMATGGPGSSTNAPGNAMGGGYDFPAVYMHVRGAYTNTVPTDAYRGAGKPEANYLLERLIDAAAAQLGLDPVELRRRNLIERFPHPTPMATTIEDGRFADNIDPALQAADYPGFAARRQAAEARGRLLGIGVTCFLETARGAPDEGAEIRFEEDGTVSLLLGSQSNGQGHETSFPQIAAGLLGLPIEAFRYVQADTSRIPNGNGHGGARSLHQGGTAMVRAAEAAIEKGRTLAARLLQARPDQVGFDEGRFSVEGRSIGLLEAAAAAEPAERLDSYIWNKLNLITFPNGVHVAEVEIDPETGVVALLRYVGVDDFGRVVNPMLLIGQVQGGIAQGIGQALLEHTVYDPASGQLLSGSFMDYTLPRAADLPDIDIHLDGIPTLANPLGVKGAGQAGAIAAPQAVMSAILNALAPIGVAHLDMPATPERVWRAIQAAR